MKFLPHEIEFFSNPEPMLLKKQVIQKVITSFEDLSEKLMKEFNIDALIGNKAIQNKSGKITRGESHHDLPFVVLDAPFFILDQNLFLFRTFFWWGKYVTFNVIVKGKTFEQQVLALMNSKHESGEIKCLSNSNLWLNDIENKDYKAYSLSELIKQWEAFKFIRLSKKLPFEEIENLEMEALVFFRSFQHLFS
jgi:hypothetical protein